MDISSNKTHNNNYNHNNNNNNNNEFQKLTNNRKRSLAEISEKNENELTPPSKNPKLLKDNETLNGDVNLLTVGREVSRHFNDSVRVLSINEEIDSLAPPLEQLHISLEKLRELEQVQNIHFVSFFIFTLFILSISGLLECSCICFDISQQQENIKNSFCRRYNSMDLNLFFSS
jgi:hypothetical protein